MYGVPAKMLPAAQALQFQMSFVADQRPFAINELHVFGEFPTLHSEFPQRVRSDVALAGYQDSRVMPVSPRSTQV